MKKQNKRNKLARITLALLLILSMIGNTLILPAVAQENLAPTDETILPETPLDGTSDATGAATLPAPIQLTAADIPEFISAAALEERGAVERMRGEETNMSSVIFRNADGTRTMYMYGLPVKYTAMDGTVRDKSTNLVSVSTASVLLADQPVAQTMVQMSTTQRAALQEELGILDAERAATTLHMLSTALTAQGKSLSDMAYATLDNDVYALFPTNLAQGMTLVFGEHSVRMTPAGNGLTVTAGGNVTKTTTASLADSDVAERLLYPNVFGLGTAVQYTPTLTGVKEEILLSRNVGKNSFAFLLETGGLVLTEQNGQFVLIDPETEQTVGTLGEIIVFDSAGQIVRGSMTAQTILAGQKYGITISVDQEFLANATYPVSIDPTINSFFDTSFIIEDIGLYNHEDAWTWTFEDFPYIGKTVQNNYFGGVLYRFPFIYDSSVLPFDEESNNPLATIQSSAQVGSAFLFLTSISGTPNAEDLHTKASPVSWSTNGMRICDEDVYNTAIEGNDRFSGNIITSSNTITIDVTDIMRSWLDYENEITIGSPVDPEKGLFLYTDDSNVSICLGGAEYYDSLYVPSLQIDYITKEQTGPYYINNKGSKQFLLCTDPYTMSLQTGRVEDFGADMEWILYYMGYHVDNNVYALSPVDHQGISFINSAGTMSIAAGTPADNSKWTVITDETDFVFRNTLIPTNVLSVVVNSNYSIEVVGCTTLVTTVTEISDTNIDNRSKWRLIHKDQYIEFPDMSQVCLTIQPRETINVYDELGMDTYDLTTMGEELYVYGHNSTFATVYDGNITPILMGETLELYVNHIPTQQFVAIKVLMMSVKNGKHFIRNKQTLNYAQLLGSVPMNGGCIGQGSFDNNLYQEYEFNMLDDGYYTIKIPNDDTGGYYLGVSNDLASEGEFIVTKYAAAVSALTDGAKWKVLSIAGGGYKLIPKLNENLGFVMGLETTEAIIICQTPYVGDTNFNDEWYIHSIRSAFSIGGEFFEGEDVIDAANSWAECGYDSIYDIDPAETDLNADSLNSTIVYFSSHGSQHFLELHNDVYLVYDALESISGWVDIADYTLPEAKLYIYDACNTAKKENDDDTNLCTATLQSGAECVIGWTDEIIASDSRQWQNRFQAKLAEGYSVISAANYANTFFYTYDNNAIKSWRIYGNQDLIINPSNTPTSDISEPNFINTNIVYIGSSKSTIESVIKNLFPSFVMGLDAYVMVTPTAEDDMNFAIDYIYLKDGYLTNSGYSLIVKDGYITCVRKLKSAPTISALSRDSSNAPQVTPEIIEMAYVQAELELRQMNPNYVIAEQSGDQYYCIESDEYYYRVKTIYKTESGAFGVIVTMYKL